MTCIRARSVRFCAAVEARGPSFRPAGQDVLQGDLKGVYHLGVDFGKRADFTVFAVVEQLRDETLRLVYLKELPLGTAYASATGWVRRLNQAFRFSSATLDQTGVGEAPVEDVKTFLPKADGVILTNKMKLDVLSTLRVVMQQTRLRIALDRALIPQLNEQEYEINKTRT